MVLIFSFLIFGYLFLDNAKQTLILDNKNNFYKPIMPISSGGEGFGFEFRWNGLLYCN